MAKPLTAVLDASALLAVLHQEPGAREVEKYLDRAAMSSVNWAEVLQKSISREASIDGLREEVESLGLVITPFTAEDAEFSAKVWPTTKRFGLSLGDRACLALAHRVGLPAITADHSWSQLKIDVQVQVVR